MENNVDTIIGLNVVLKGSLKNKGSIQINGNVEGEVKSDENVMVGETATIKGPVAAKTIEISGTVKGVVEATDKLELNPTGKVIGDINAKSLIIKQGAKFVGKSIMPQEAGEKVIEDEEAPTQGLEPSDKIVGNEKMEKENKKAEPAEDKFGFFKK